MERFPLIFWLASGLSVLVGIVGAGIHTFLSVNSVVLLVLVIVCCWSLGAFEENRNRARSAESKNVDDFSFSNRAFRPIVFSVLGVLGFFSVLD